MTHPVHVCTQRVLPAELMRFQPTTRSEGRTRAIALLGKLWMNGSTLRVRFMGGTAEQQAKVREQAAWWTAHANLTFDFNNAPDAEIRVAFDTTKGAWSYVGTDCRGIPTDQPTMNLGFMDGGTVAHEFGHAIGLMHEHQNPAGGIEWNEATVIRDLSGPPNNWSEATIRHNVLNKYRADQINGTAFDPDSVMLYFFPDSWVQSGKGTRANPVLSANDKAFIGGARAYPKPAPTVIDAKELKVGATRRTSAAIGQFGEEDLFQFTVSDGGSHTVDTRGSTDVVMKLFGPDSATAVIAEDDDSGVDTNALIRADLIPGRYYVQVRHYNRANGMGKYTVKVRKA
ncbi:M12 family metallopeptidase [Hydrogenophaga sp. BPS33]|uniref:M12 family metallopeptidase n=1 Tax=Hydrogenophaga sp. BPS33 TaxID=2651974 RepID=UPI00131F58B5|nr:M12 family metallopeptidase [Hydrogenophaga sp. BPS33]QHE86694.1 peptidase [Hydrogenophaga sp. BPS33]